MEDLQTDTLSDYGKNQNPENTTKDSENPCAATLLNGCEEIDDPLDLMDNCDNASIGSNSDVWKGSDSEDDCFENKENPPEKSESGENIQPKPTETTDEMKEAEPEGNNIIEPESKDEEKNEENATSEPTTQDDGGDGSDKHTTESEQLEEENSVIESEEQNTTQEVDTTGNPDEENEKTDEAKEPEQDIPKEDDKELETTPEEKETDAEEKETNLAEEAEEKETNLAKEAEEKESNHVEEAEAKETNPPEEKDAQVDKNDKAQEESASENTENSTTETANTAEVVEQKDDANKEADPLTDTAEKDPLASDDPLNNAPVEKDPLQVENAETDPLAAEGERDPLSLRRPDRNNDGQDDDESQIDYSEDYDDFDPSLLCPEVSMAVDESPVITNSGLVPNDGNSSPLPYEPVFSTYVDEVTGAEISFNLNPEEQELRRRLYGPTNPIQITKIHCTACNVHLGSALEGQNNRFVHPLLKVLICKECYHFYTSGEFEKDEDGSELYCRWCGQGGQVLCCSKCEFVFCKRCIRTNFGRKKMFEIRDSDSWDCFRCAPSQLITQRIACYEFFEYVRREISRASALNEPEIWSKDHTRCCNKEKKKTPENGEEVKKPKKKRGSDVDPDYNPIAKPILLPGQSPVTSLGASQPQTFTPPEGIVLPKPVQVLPRYKPKDNDIEFVRHIPAPQVALNPINRPSTSAQYRKILPSNIRPVMQPPSMLRMNSQMSPLTPPSRLLNSALQGRAPTAHTMKHEWFEKTVRAAARVNSHLSYTLTQLNKAQSQAASVEELAVVHNKLQEILSSSINSLIQIRKNLRTEFIAGIKTVRLPSKKVDSFANDDDVIFVSAPSTVPIPSTSQVKNIPDPIIIIDKSNQLTPSVNTNSTKTNETASNSTPVERPKGGYLKVKSVFELQNVPSECITIPDDTPTPIPTPNLQVNDSQKETESSVAPPEVIVCNGLSNNETTAQSSRSKTPDPLSITPEPPSKAPAEVVSKTSDAKKNTAASENSRKGEPPMKKIKIDLNASTNEPNRDLRTRRSKERSKAAPFNLKEPDSEIKRMMSVTVKLPKVDLQDLQKQLPNGCH